MTEQSTIQPIADDKKKSERRRIAGIAGIAAFGLSCVALGAVLMSGGSPTATDATYTQSVAQEREITTGAWGLTYNGAPVQEGDPIHMTGDYSGMVPGETRSDENRITNTGGVPASINLTDFVAAGDLETLGTVVEPTAMGGVNTWREGMSFEEAFATGTQGWSFPAGIHAYCDFSDQACQDAREASRTTVAQGGSAAVSDAVVIQPGETFFIRFSNSLDQDATIEQASGKSVSYVATFSATQASGA